MSEATILLDRNMAEGPESGLERQMIAEHLLRRAPAPQRIPEVRFAEFAGRAEESFDERSLYLCCREIGKYRGEVEIQPENQNLMRCKMRSIIALLRGESDAARSTQRLKEAGLPKDRISIFTQEKAIRKLLGCEPTCVVSRYAVWGASLGMAVYALFGLFAGLCQCNLFHFGQAYGIFAFLGGILAGAFVGGGLGCLVGAAEFEKDSHLYVQGARMGGRVIVIQASEEETESVKLILEQEKASGVKAI